MKRSKKVFLLLALAFLAVVAIIGYDISQRTTFPGSKPALQERISGEDNTPKDSLSDSLHR